MQPIETDEHGVVRFKENKVVRYLYDQCVDKMKIYTLPFSDEDREQFSQLTGYSVSGYGDLSHVRKDSVRVADAMVEAMGNGKDERDVRIETLQKQLDDIRRGLREPVAALFGISPEDLSEDE